LTNVKTWGGETLDMIYCVICRRYVEIKYTNLLFMDQEEEIRVCNKCDVE